MSRKASLTTEMVVQEALAMVQAGGFNSLSYRGLARQLKVQPQTLYRYVANIEVLQIAVILAFLDQVIATAQAAVIGMSGQEALLAFARATFEFSRQNHAFSGMLYLISQINDQQAIREKILELREIPLLILQRSQTDPKKIKQRVQVLLSLIFGFIEFTDVGLYADKSVASDALVADLTAIIPDWFE
ncbi:helix-turn-helix domain-containing protein [Loigolactobacillus jiayinensis]|uniref:TetR/AcrR family transcriptional regulator n=1 Tax=Loigolactobacillus jiayinensis TaxID=2486016 RepID=A0ABW1RG99_9LACO|nr:TetR/AcrR family transcriptional regulator [Loigolactobacillus jiayinensis]